MNLSPTYVIGESHIGGGLASFDDLDFEEESLTLLVRDKGYIESSWGEWHDDPLCAAPPPPTKPKRPATKRATKKKPVASPPKRTVISSQPDGWLGCALDYPGETTPERYPERIAVTCPHLMWAWVRLRQCSWVGLRLGAVGDDYFRAFFIDQKTGETLFFLQVDVLGDCEDARIKLEQFISDALVPLQ